MAVSQLDSCALLPFSAGQLTPMQAIEARHAVRSYIDEPLAPEAVEVLREIEAKSHLAATAVANNTHLQEDTDEAVVVAGIPFAQEVVRLAGLPLAFTTVPAETVAQDADRQFPRFGRDGGAGEAYPVRVYVRTPWQ